MRFVVLLLLVVLTAGCQWVKPTNEGGNVALVKPIHVTNCEKLGSNVSSVKDRVGFIERKERKVAQELVTLAKNEAARVGGDSIVAIGSIDDGRQKFDIYKCH